MQKKFTILGIETSCDETAAAVYQTKRGMLSNTIYSQIDLHKNFGGVVPELASRSQIEKINPVVQQSLDQAHITLDNVDVVSVTNKPGLPGSLLVGLCFAKSISWAKNKNIIGVNHLEGHVYSTMIEHDVPFPHLCLTASGGHTSLYLIKNFGDYEVLGETLDDAAGEAFDKIARLMNLPYPGGPVIEKLAQEVDFKDYFNYPRGKGKTLNFSFSGLKTAVLYDLVNKNAYDMHNKMFLKDKDETLKKAVSSSLLVCIADIFEQKLTLALKQYPQAKAITFAGGVACNKYICNRLQSLASKNNLLFFTPSQQYCTDNGAMIAFVGHYKAQKGLFDCWDLDIG